MIEIPMVVCQGCAKQTRTWKVIEIPAVDGKPWRKILCLECAMEISINDEDVTIDMVASVLNRLFDNKDLLMLIHYLTELMVGSEED